MKVFRRRRGLMMLTGLIAALVLVMAGCDSAGAGGGGGGGGGGGSDPAPTVTYTVTYDANGATSGTPPIDTSDYDSGAEVTILGNTSGLAKGTDTFNGWNTRPAVTGPTTAKG